ncbi:MAG: hypothetical protein ACYCV5_13485 [Acidimicrobiales bacterium]
MMLELPGALGSDDELGRLGSDDELGTLGSDDELGTLGSDEAPGPVTHKVMPFDVDADSDPPSPLTLSEPPPEAEPGSGDAGRPGVDTHFVLVAGSDGMLDPDADPDPEPDADPDPDPEDGRDGADGSPELVRQMVMPLVLESVTDPPLPEKLIVPPPDADPGNGSAGGAGVEKHFVPARLDGLGIDEALGRLGRDEELGRLGRDEELGSPGRLGNDEAPGKVGSPDNDDRLVSAVGLGALLLAPLGRAPPATNAMPTAPAAPPARHTAFNDLMLYLPWSP